MFYIYVNNLYLLICYSFMDFDHKILFRQNLKIIVYVTYCKIKYSIFLYFYAFKLFFIDFYIGFFFSLMIN